ncbi:MAG: transcription initiation factor IIB [Nitrososphaeria archaeon]
MAAAPDEVVQRCPFCHLGLIVDSASGELICPKCGVVIRDRAVDEHPEWKAIDLEDKQKRVRVGAPLTYLLHDEGLSTLVGDRPYGYTSTFKQANDARKIKSTYSMIRVSADERSLMKLLEKIEDLATKLSLPNNVAETAAYLIRSSKMKAFAKNKGQKEIAAAMIYLACRLCNVNRTLKEVADLADLREKDVAKYYRALAQNFSASPVSRPRISNYVTKLSNILNLSTKVERLALDLSSKVEVSEIALGKNPAGLAAACVHIACTLFDESISSDDIAAELGVTPLTVRNRTKEILQSYDVIVYVGDTK